MSDERGRAAGLVARATARASEAARGLRRSPAYQHAIAARERGNLEAAFWLLGEEFGARPDDEEVATSWWDLAVALERVALAAPAAVALVKRHASKGEPALAAQYWCELVDAVPEALVPATALARILPVLRQRIADAPEDERHRAREFASRAVRHAVDPRNEGLMAGVALRVFEEGREVNPEAARRAAFVALESPELHQAKRERLRAWVAGEEIPPASSPRRRPEPAARTPETPAEGATPAPRAALRPRPHLGLTEDEIAVAAARLPSRTAAREGRDETSEKKEAAPGAGGIEVFAAVSVALGPDALEVRVAGDRAVRVPWTRVEAVSAAAIGKAEEPLVDLVLNWSRHGEESLRVVRLHGDAFDPTALAGGAADPAEALAQLLAEILDRTRAIPLPDPESALGLRLASFPDVAAYERSVLHLG